MSRRLIVDDWLSTEHTDVPDGSCITMMSRVANYHNKHHFSLEENQGHNMGFRIALTVEELGELSAAITKGKPDEEAAEELADLLILLLGHSLAMEVDLEGEFHKKMNRVMTRNARKGNLGIRVTEYSDD